MTVDLIACLLASLRAGESQHARAGGEQTRVGLSESLPELEKTSESVGLGGVSSLESKQVLLQKPAGEPQIMLPFRALFMTDST